eukprot:3131898-Pleurochrysis_carterae.AAC.1
MLLLSCADLRGTMEDEWKTTSAGSLHDLGKASTTKATASVARGMTCVCSTPVKARSFHAHLLSWRVADAGSSGPELKFEAAWARGLESPPFQADNLSAVEFLYAVLDSAVGRRIEHSFSVSEAVAVQIARLFLNVKTADTARLLAPHTGLSAVYIALAFLYHKQRVPAPGKDDLRRRRAPGLLEALRVAVNQRRRDSDFAGLSAIDAEKQLLMRRDGINLDGSIFESSLLFSKAATETAACAAGSAASTSPHSCAGSSRHRAGSSSMPSERRSQPPLARSSTGSSHVAAVPGVPAGGDADADGNADAIPEAIPIGIADYDFADAGAAAPTFTLASGPSCYGGRYAL